MREIFERRSIRKYTNKDVEDFKIKKLLEAGAAAPSAGNEQPWHFVVIKDRDRLNKLADIHPYGKMLKDAPLAVAVCADLNQLKYEHFWVQDCAAATQNILLEAVSLGLGAVWLGVHPNKNIEADVNKFLDLPDHVTTVSVISIGYPAEQKRPSKRFSEDILHYDKW
ncbi:MAG: nitroreductase family protein [Halanaerobium sp.]